MITPSGAISGVVLTGQTAPTVTWTQSQAPLPNQKQFLATAVGGTQPGAAIHSGSRPFLYNWQVPTAYKAARYAPTTGLILNPGVNIHRELMRMSAPCDASSSTWGYIEVETTYRIPVGVDVFGSNQLSVILSAKYGLSTNQINGIKDTLTTGGA